MRRQKKYGLEVVPTFDQAAKLKPAIKTPPPPLVALDTWNSPAISAIRANNEDIETAQELTVRGPGAVEDRP